ncbi:hypothetical protein Tco_0068805, partial [Tanacetum coccineum]
MHKLRRGESMLRRSGRITWINILGFPSRVRVKAHSKRLRLCMGQYWQCIIVGWKGTKTWFMVEYKSLPSTKEAGNSRRSDKKAAGLEDENDMRINNEEGGGEAESNSEGDMSNEDEGDDSYKSIYDGGGGLAAGFDDRN